jgi:hypothetical protein
MRRCRYRPCGQLFQPAQRHHYWCSWACRQASLAANDYRGSQRHADERYDEGFADGVRARPDLPLDIPHGIWRGLLLFAHPDKWQREPGLLPLATAVTQWLLAHRPAEAERPDDD